MDDQFLQKKLEEATKLAPNLRILIHRTIRLMDEWIEPFISEHWIEASEFVWKGDSFQNRFDFFLKNTEVLQDIEYGGRFYFGILCHAYKLNEFMPVTMDDELRASARIIAERIWKTDEADYPKRLLEDFNDGPPSSSLPDDFSLTTDDNVFKYLGLIFGSALAYANGYCAGITEELSPEALDILTYGEHGWIRVCSPLLSRYSAYGNHFESTDWDIVVRFKM